MRVSIYARYSSDKQREASIEDQTRLCEERARRENWTVVKRYSDHAISGASLMRRGIQELMQDAQSGKFDLVLTESLDRISRDQEDIAGVYKRLRFAGVKIYTLSEGEIAEPYRFHWYDECPLPQEPRGKDLAGTEWAYPGWQIWRWQLLWL
jgi:site-specific DNA recombinase